MPKIRAKTQLCFNKNCEDLNCFERKTCDLCLDENCIDEACCNTKKICFENCCKEEIIENNFFPVMRLSELIDGYKANMGTQGQNNKYVNIEISQDDWKEFMTHYFSDKRFLDIADFPMKATFSH